MLKHCKVTHDILFQIVLLSWQNVRFFPDSTVLLQFYISCLYYEKSRDSRLFLKKSFSLIKNLMNKWSCYF